LESIFTELKDEKGVFVFPNFPFILGGEAFLHIPIILII